MLDEKICYKIVVLRFKLIEEIVCKSKLIYFLDYFNSGFRFQACMYFLTSEHNNSRLIQKTYCFIWFYNAVINIQYSTI